MGTMLQIKPVLIVNDEGKLETVAKARGRKAALTTLVDKVVETAINPEEQTMFISHSACREDAESVAAEVKARCGVKEVVISDIGPVIGSHTGVGCIAMCFLGTHR
jgi:DegV family protein with EDD domain